MRAGNLKEDAQSLLSVKKGDKPMRQNYKLQQLIFKTFMK